MVQGYRGIWREIKICRFVHSRGKMIAGWELVAMPTVAIPTVRLKWQWEGLVGFVRGGAVVGSTLAFGSICHGFESEHHTFSHHSASAYSKLRSLACYTHFSLLDTSCGFACNTPPRVISSSYLAVSKGIHPLSPPAERSEAGGPVACCS